MGEGAVPFYSDGEARSWTKVDGKTSSRASKLLRLLWALRVRVTRRRFCVSYFDIDPSQWG